MGGVDKGSQVGLQLRAQREGTASVATRLARPIVTIITIGIGVATAATAARARNLNVTKHEAVAAVNAGPEGSQGGGHGGVWYQIGSGPEQDFKLERVTGHRRH